jgi:hypothetical protein
MAKNQNFSTMFSGISDFSKICGKIYGTKEGALLWPYANQALLRMDMAENRN